MKNLSKPAQLWNSIFFLLIPILIFSSLSFGTQFRRSVPIKEARAVWLHRFEYCNFTSTHDQDSIRMYISEVINSAARANFNMIIFQVRGNADAYYASGYEPWGHLLTGNLGEDPGWDPLQFALDLAHERGLELHAWLNTFPAWRGPTPPPETVPRSPYLEHPEWLVCDIKGRPMSLNKGYVSFSPGIPEVHDYIIKVAADIVRRYDVDGIHFDYIRYPENSPERGYSHDPISVSLFNSDRGNPYRLNWGDWQRDQLTQFVIKMYNTLTQIKPRVKISTAVIGSYRSGDWNAYNAVYQDPRRWSEMGKVDFIAPMIYWPRRHETFPFTELSREWKQYYSLDRFVFPGIGSYRYNGKRRNYRWREAQGQIDDLRKWQFPGMIFFDAKSLKSHWKELAATHFKTLANIPAMTWKDDTPPSKPQITEVVISGDSVKISWSPTAESDGVRRYNIYFTKRLPVDTGNSRNLAAVTNGPVTKWIIIKRNIRNSYVAVSALDAAWNESPPSDPIKLEIRRR